MNTHKITVPSNVANAIAHYVDLADTKTEAFTDILRLGYEAERSEIILRHFEHDYDELMEALICGYEVEKTPDESSEGNLAEFYAKNAKKLDNAHAEEIDYFYGIKDGIQTTLMMLGIKIEGVND